MTGSKNGPFANEDAVVAVGLAFAGMAILQSKLFPAVAGFRESLLAGLFDWKLLEWWPLLLIVGGVWIWIRDKRRKSLTSSSRPGGQK
jgi:hypothetical protein